MTKIKHNCSHNGWKNGWRDTFFQMVSFLFTIDLLIQKVQLAYVHLAYTFIPFLMHSNGIDPLLSVISFCWYAAKKNNLITLNED